MRRSSDKKSNARSEQRSTPAEKKQWHHQPLVSKTPVVTSAVCLFGKDASVENYHRSLKQFTGHSPARADDVIMTPNRTHVHTDEHGVCGHTPNGTDLIYSTSKKVRFREKSMGGTQHAETILMLLARRASYQSCDPKPFFESFRQQPVLSCDPLVVTATHESRQSQPSRATVRGQRAAVGASARELAIQLCQHVEDQAAATAIADENWNLCHLLSYAIAKNARTETGELYDTQVRNNLYAGTRVLNENMMRIENALLELLDRNEVKAIQYAAIHSVFEDSHVLASLTLKTALITHDDRIIEFEYPFRVDENRLFSTELTTALYVFLRDAVMPVFARQLF